MPQYKVKNHVHECTTKLSILMSDVTIARHTFFKANHITVICMHALTTISNSPYPKGPHIDTSYR